MHRKLVKQLIYSSLYLGVIVLIVVGFYFISLKPEPSCFDQKQNQNETGVDCGGSCQSCDVQNLLEVRTLPVRFIEAPQGRTSVLLEFQNPNVRSGADPLTYEVQFLDKNNKQINSFEGKAILYPGEIAFRVEPNINVLFSQIQSAAIITPFANWKPVISFTQPHIQERSVITSLEDKGIARISGILKNDNAFKLSSVVIHVAVFNKLASLIGVSRTLVEGLDEFEERTFELIVPLNDQSALAEELDVNLSFEAKK